MTARSNTCQTNVSGPGLYEVWFFTLNDPATGNGFWIRYAVDAPLDGSPLQPALWAMFFDASGGAKPFGARQSFPAATFQTGGELVAGIGGHAFRGNRLTGEAASTAHSIAWDLEFEPSPDVFEHVPARVRTLVRPKSTILAPHLATRFSGTIVVDGTRHDLDGAPGCQQHLWGRKHAETWAWAHCNAFAGNADAVFEGLAARTLLGRFRTPPLTLLYLRHGGEEFRFNDIRHILTTRNLFGEFAWHFHARSGDVRIRGTARTAPERFLQVEYPDPDGDRTYCLNTEIGDMTIAVERQSGMRWRRVATLASKGTTHFELASRERRPDVALLGQN